MNLRQDALVAALLALLTWSGGLTLPILFALAAQWIAWLNGSLYAAMLLHFSYDVAAGYVYMRLTAKDPEAQVA